MSKNHKKILTKRAYFIPVLGIFSGIFISLVYLNNFRNFKTNQNFNSFTIRNLSQKETNDNTVTLVAVGDVMLGRKVNQQSISKNNFKWAFEKTADFLGSADITLINLEGTLIANCPTTQTGFYFCGDTRHIEGLKFAGVDIANLANNHAYNFGTKGIEETIKLLEENNISPLGVSGTVYKDINGARFAFLGYNDITLHEPIISWADNKSIESEVKQAARKSDILVVTFHWGIEYSDKPSLRQIELAHLAIDSGADLIIGHHPHWIQTTENYKDKLIVYSLGNFIFDQMWSQKTREGLIGKFVFEDQKITNYELIPILIEDFGQPRLSEDK